MGNYASYLKKKKKIIIIFIIIVLLFVFYEGIKLKHKVAYVLKTVNSINGTYYSYQQQNLRQNFMLELLKKHALGTQVINQHSSLSPMQKEFLFFLAEESLYSIPQRTDAYRKLAIDNYTHSDIAGKWHSILQISAALDLEYSESNISLLANFLKLPHDTTLLTKLGVQSKELAHLKDLLNNESIDDDKKILLAARIFWILKRGRASATDTILPPNLIEAFKVKKIAFNRIINSNVKPLNKVDILLIIDDNYADPATVTISSILLNALPYTQYHFYFLINPDSPISDANLEKIKSLKYMHDVTFTFIDFPEEINKIDKQKPDSLTNKDFPKLLAYRLYIDKALPEVNKILYLDADLVVNTDLQNLFNKNIDDYYLAAALDVGTSFTFSKELSTCSGQKIPFYFNNGVLLLNLKKMRSENFYTQVSDFFYNSKQCALHCYEQDIFNVLANNNVYQLSNTWNFPEVLNHRVEFMSITETTNPNINHMYFRSAKKGEAKPWKQKNAQKLWEEHKLDQIHKSFWPYWAYMDLVKEMRSQNAK